MTSNESLLAMIKTKDTQIATLVKQVRELNASVIELTKEVDKAAQNNNKRQDNHGKRGRDNNEGRKCPHCGKDAHRRGDDTCYEQEANAKWRPHECWPRRPDGGRGDG